MKKGIKMFGRTILTAALLLSFTACALYTSKPVTSAVNSNELRIGMSPEEVRSYVGLPDEVSKRELGNGKSSEVWTYYEYGPNLRGCTLAFFESWTKACTICFVPFPPKLQYVVFENERVIGWNKPDAFSKPSTVDERNMQ